MLPGGRPGRVNQKPVQRLTDEPLRVSAAHPPREWLWRPGMWQKARLRLVSSLSGQAQARAPCQAAPPGVRVWCKAWERVKIRHPWSSSQRREVMNPHPETKSKPTPGLGRENLLSVCPALPSQTKLPSPCMHHLLSSPGPVQATRGPEHLIPTSKSFLAPPLPGIPFPHHSGWVRHPLWAPTIPWTSWPALSAAGQ